MKDESIINKIRKLLDLSKSSDYENESYVAFQKAQELMVKYKLSETDISPEEVQKQVCVQVRTPFSYSTRSSDHYIDILAKIIAENFCCIEYIGTMPGSQTHYVYFMGMQEDVSICIEAMNIADRVIKKGYNKVYKKLSESYGASYVPAKVFNPYKIGYVKGYLAGLQSAFDKQKQEHPEYAIVLVAPQEAQDYIGGLETVAYSNPHGTNPYFYNDGYKDGASFQLNKKIDMNNVEGHLV